MNDENEDADLKRTQEIMSKIMVEYKDTLTALAGTSKVADPEWEHKMKLAEKQIEKYKKR